MRDAPAVEIIHLLQNERARIKAYDPVAMEVAKGVLNDVTYCANPYEVAEGSDALVVMTEWNEFKHLDMARIKKAMRQPILVDGRNMYDVEEIQKLGFVYRGMGRGY